MNSNLIIFAQITFSTPRLGMYLFVRIMKEGEDRRFREIKRSVPSFFAAWTMQGTIWNEMVLSSQALLRLDIVFAAW